MSNRVLRLRGLFYQYYNIAQNQPQTIALLFVLAGTVLGTLVYNPTDVPAYTHGTTALLNGENIYHSNGVVYPPFLYALGALGFAALEVIGIPLSESALLQIGVFMTISATAHATIYLLGYQIVPEKYAVHWLFASLLNPFAIYVTLIFGQMSVLVTFGITTAVYAQHTDRYRIGGFGLAIAAAVKLYPAVIFLPFLVSNRKHIKQIVVGAAPIAILTLGLLVYYLTNPFAVLDQAPHSVRPITFLSIVSNRAVQYGFADRIFKVGFALTVAAATLLPLDDDFRLVLPVLPVAILYPNLLEYRWLPLATGLLLIGYLNTRNSANVARAHRWGGWGVTLLGTTGMLTGTLEGMIEGVPWLVSPLVDVTQPPVVVPIDVLVIIRQAVSLVVAVVSVVVVLYSLRCAWWDKKSRRSVS